MDQFVQRYAFEDIDTSLTWRRPKVNHYSIPRVGSMKIELALNITSPLPLRIANNSGASVSISQYGLPVVQYSATLAFKVPPPSGVS